MIIYKGMSHMPTYAHEKPPTRQLQTRLNLNYRPLSMLRIDLKVMS